MNLEERLQREDWPKIAFAVKWLAGGMCSSCGRKFPYPYLGLHAHHKVYVRLGNELPCDLAALCDACHANTTWRKKYGDLAGVKTAELLGIVEAKRLSLGEVNEFYWRDIQEMRRTLDEVGERLGMLLAATAAEREWNEGRRAA